MLPELFLFSSANISLPESQKKKKREQGNNK